MGESKLNESKGNLIKIGVRVMPREVILDTQGRAVEKLLTQKQMAVDHCRVGRFVELDFKQENPESAMQKAKLIAESVLHNPLIETYELIPMSSLSHGR